MARVARSLEHREAQAEPLVDVAVGAEEVREVQAVGAVHRVPAHGLLERLGRTGVVALTNAGQAEVGVHAVQGLVHLAQLARVVLDATVGQALEQRGEAEPLHVLGRRAVGRHVLLGIRRHPAEQGLGEVRLALDEKPLGLHQVFVHA